MAQIDWSNIIFYDWQKSKIKSFEKVIQQNISKDNELYLYINKELIYKKN